MTLSSLLSSSSSSSSSTTSQIDSRRHHDDVRSTALNPYHRFRHPSPPMTVCFILLAALTMSPPEGALVLARRHATSHLDLWIDESQVEALTKLKNMPVFIIQSGIVTPYINSEELYENIIIPSDINTVNLTWQAGNERYKYLFYNFTSLDEELLYQPLLGIPNNGTIPALPSGFQISMPCTGKKSGLGRLQIGLKIFNEYKQPVVNPIKFKLKKNCAAFGVTRLLCGQGCRNGGVCNSLGVCECTPGYTGPFCEIAMCSPPCQNNGTCISPSVCECKPGFYGDHCEKDPCKQTCQNGGYCMREGYCWCQGGFYGNSCELSYCKPSCLNGGTCYPGNRCACTAQSSGERCEVIERPKRSDMIITQTSPASVESPSNHGRDRERAMNIKRKKSIEEKLQRNEKKLLKLIRRRSRQHYDLSAEDLSTVRRLTLKAEKGGLTLRERRKIIKIMTRMRNALRSKDKSKLQRFKSLIRRWKKRPRKSKRKRKKSKKSKVFIK